MDSFKFMELKEEVDLLERRHNESLDDPSMSYEEKRQIASEYTDKYKELDKVASDNISEYREFDN